MNDALVLGGVFGAIVGIVHGGYVYAERSSRRGSSSLEALYYALWTFGLWVLFGSYVLYLGLLAGAAYVTRNAARRLRAPRGSSAPWT